MIRLRDGEVSAAPSNCTDSSKSSKPSAPSYASPDSTTSPPAAREEVSQILGEPDDDGGCKLGVQKLFQSLEFSEGEELRDRAGLYAPLKNHLANRSQSLLAHGLQPVSKAAYRNFWTAGLQALEIDEAAIPRWPRLGLRL